MLCPLLHYEQGVSFSLLVDVLCRPPPTQDTRPHTHTCVCGNRGSNSVKCQFALAHRGSGWLQGPDPPGWGGGGTGAGGSVKGQASRLRDTVTFRTNQMDRNDCFAAFLRGGKSKHQRDLHSSVAKCQPQTQNGQQTHTHTHTVCEAAALMKQQHNAEFGRAVLETSPQATVAKRQLAMIKVEAKVKVRT